MVLKLYMYEASGAARSILMTAAALGIKIEKKILDMEKEEHKSPEFLKLNPQHTVPTLTDGDYVLWESHAIGPYLVDRYGKDDWLYPKDLQKRGIVNQRLHYNNSVTMNVGKAIGKAIIVDKKETVPENLVDDAHEVYETLNKFLEQTNYIAGEKVTIADFSTVTTVTAFELFVPIDEEKYPKLIAWIKRMQKLPCYRVNEAGFKEMQKYVQNAWKK